MGDFFGESPFDQVYCLSLLPSLYFHQLLVEGKVDVLLLRLSFYVVHRINFSFLQQEYIKGRYRIEISIVVFEICMLDFQQL